MTVTANEFLIDVYSAAGVKLNPHTQAVSGVRITDRVSQIGELEFSMPAVVAQQLGSARGLRYKVSHGTLGLLGTYRHYDMTTSANEQTATIKCYDSLIDLASEVFAFGRSYVTATFASIAASVLGYAGWTATYEAGFDSSQLIPSMEFQGENYLRALDVMRQYVRGFFRRESDTVIQFGGYNATTPVYRLYGPAFGNSDGGSDYASIQTLQRIRQGSSVVNRVYAFGAGVGETQIDLRHSNRSSPYTIQSVTLHGGELAYYIEDAASIATYGRVDKVMNITEVRPITNSAADLQNAGNAVYDLATAYLLKSRTEQEIYSMTVVGLPWSVKVGSLIRVDYRGMVTLETGDVVWLDLVNQKFFITQIVWDFGDSGQPVAQLTVSRNGEEVLGTTEVFSSLISDVGSLKLRVQPNMTYFTKSSPTQPMEVATTRWAQLKWFHGLEVLQLNEMKVEFRLDPLRTYTTATGASTATSSGGGGAATPTSAGGSVAHTHPITITSTGTGGVKALYIDGGLNITKNDGSGNVTTATGAESATHTHTVTLVDHTHNIAHTHPISFSITDDSQNLSGVAVYVNGVGPVNNIINADTLANVGSSCNGPGYFYVDILATLLAGGDFRNRTHTVELRAVGNRGQAFLQLLSRVTIQAIAQS